MEMPEVLETRWLEQWAKGILFLKRFNVSNKTFLKSWTCISPLTFDITILVFDYCERTNVIPCTLGPIKTDTTENKFLSISKKNVKTKKIMKWMKFAGFSSWQIARGGSRTIPEALSCTAQRRMSNSSGLRCIWKIVSLANNLFHYFFVGKKTMEKKKKMTASKLTGVSTRDEEGSVNGWVVSRSFYQ
jgi:hypothetical protein